MQPYSIIKFIIISIPPVVMILGLNNKS